MGSWSQFDRGNIGCQNITRTLWVFMVLSSNKFMDLEDISYNDHVMFHWPITCPQFNSYSVRCQACQLCMYVGSQLIIKLRHQLVCQHVLGWQVRQVAGIQSTNQCPECVETQVTFNYTQNDLIWDETFKIKSSGKQTIHKQYSDTCMLLRPWPS